LLKKIKKMNVDLSITTIQNTYNRYTGAAIYSTRATEEKIRCGGTEVTECSAKDRGKI
jgi:hypothetical protein